MNTLLTKPEPSKSLTPNAEDSLRSKGTLAQPAAAQPRARILYVDDDFQLRELADVLLVRSGYAVDTAADGAIAWEALQHTHYNLLITDQDMPRVTGLELANNARLAGMRLPIVITSGSPNFLQNHTCAELDVAAFLPKPFEHEDLMATVEKVLRAANNRVATVVGSASLVERPMSAVRAWVHGGINE